MSNLVLDGTSNRFVQDSNGIYNMDGEEEIDIDRKSCVKNLNSIAETNNTNSTRLDDLL
jgi:hypothetical protein